MPAMTSQQLRQPLVSIRKAKGKTQFAEEKPHVRENVEKTLPTSGSCGSSTGEVAAAAVATTKQARRPYKGAAKLPQWWLEVTPHDVRVDPEDEERQLRHRPSVQFYAQIAVPLQEDAAPVSPLTDSSESSSDDDLAEASMYLLSKSRFQKIPPQSSLPHLNVPRLESNHQCVHYDLKDETHSVPHLRTHHKSFRDETDTLPPNMFSTLKRRTERVHGGRTNQHKFHQSSSHHAGRNVSSPQTSATTASPKNPMDPRSPGWDPSVWGIDQSNPQFELYQRGELLPERYVQAVVNYAQSIGIVDNKEEKEHRLSNDPRGMPYSTKTIWKIIEQVNQMVEC